MRAVTPLPPFPARHASRSGFEPAATAAAIAFALVIWNATAHPWSPAGSFADAIINEWIITFTALCVALMVAQAVLDRLGLVRRWRADSRAAVVREADGR